MHSLVIIAICIVMAAAFVFGLGSSVDTTAVSLAVGVALIGVPHGALDPVVGRKLLQPTAGRWWALGFVSAYLVVGACVVWGWYFCPAVTCLIFFLLSAWHFGLEEDYAAPTPAVDVKHVFAIARGSTVIWAALLLRPEESRSLLLQVMPKGGVMNVEHVLACVNFAAWILMPLAVVDLVWWAMRNENARWPTVFRVVGLLLLAGLVSPLTSFGVYFCCWHSVRGLRDLYAEAGPQLIAFVSKLVPLTALTLVLGLSALVTWSAREPFTASLVRTVFVGLSAIAIPHLALHTWYRMVAPSSSSSEASQGLILCT